MAKQRTISRRKGISSNAPRYTITILCLYITIASASNESTPNEFTPRQYAPHAPWYPNEPTTNDPTSAKYEYGSIKQCSSPTSLFFREYRQGTPRQGPLGVQPAETLIRGTNPGSDLQIINLSNDNLTLEEINLLKKGFTFTPTPCYSSFEWVKDVHLFARRLALHKFHKIQISKIQYFGRFGER